MSEDQRNTEGTVEDVKWSPSEEDPLPAVSSAPLMFSELTPSQFGISVQSFTPAAASSNHKDKTRLAQIKARRRSSIGVRGSPETNSLIRFMAQQRMKTATQQSLELVRNSPLHLKVGSTLRQKMASFQGLMDVEESEVCDPMPRQDSYTRGCIKTRDYLSDEKSKENHGQQNHSPTIKPTPNKRRCLSPLKSCDVKIREASTPVRQFNLKKQGEAEEAVKPILTQGPLPSSETRKEARAELISPPLHVDLDLDACSPTKNRQLIAEHQNPKQPLAVHPASPSSAPCVSAFYIPSLPSLLEMKPKGRDSSPGRSAKKKKKVRFGGPLSPELFDKKLPPSTPLQKGGTPARAPTPGESLQLRSVLKTPQRSEFETPQAHPDLSSPTTFGASPTLAMPCNSTIFEGEDSGETDEQIVFSSTETLDTPGTEFLWDYQPLNLNAAFNEESLSQSLTESESKDRTTSGVETSAPKSSNGAEKTTNASTSNDICESASEAPAPVRSRKRKQPEESEPAKRLTRSAAKVAFGKMKTSSTTMRRWNRDVDRSLYGSREYASKNPTLSPITERLSFISQSLDAWPIPSTSDAEPNPEAQLNPEITNGNQGTSELTVTHALETALEDCDTSPSSSPDSTRGKGRSLSGQWSQERGMKKRKVSFTDCDSRSEIWDQTGGQATTNQEASRETPVHIHAPKQKGTDFELNNGTCADILSSDSAGKSESPASLNTCPASGEEPSDLGLLAELTRQEAEQSSEDSAGSSAPQVPQVQADNHQTSHEVREQEQEDPATRQQENNSRSSSDSQVEEVSSNLVLAPWQAEFNFEDVFKPVARRGQRSVRRSLRNKSDVACSSNGAGLVWLPCTSPDTSKQARRKTRGRRRSSALPVQPPVSEETQDNNS